MKKWSKRCIACSDVEQVTGIEPACSAWEADILPLNYTCKYRKMLPQNRSGVKAGWAEFNRRFSPCRIVRKFAKSFTSLPNLCPV